MNEISAISAIGELKDYETISIAQSSQNPLWLKIGRVTLSGAVFLSVSAFIPTSGKKRSVTRVGALLQDAPVPITVPPPVPLQLDSTTVEDHSEKKTSPISLPLPAKPDIPRGIEKSGIELETTLYKKPEIEKISYANLHCTTEDQRKIGIIIRTIEKGGFDLIWKREKLDRLGDEIMPVHPYKFLSTILLDPALKESLRKIFNEVLPFKKQGFLGGVKKGMEREAANLETYMEEFATVMRTTADAIRPLIQAGDWNALVLHFLGKGP